MVGPNLSLLRLQNSSGYQSIYPPLTFKTSDFGLQLIRFLFYSASDKAVCPSEIFKSKLQKTVLVSSPTHFSCSSVSFAILKHEPEDLAKMVLVKLLYFLIATARPLILK